MKARGLLLIAVVGISAAWAETPIVIYRPAPVPTVVSPITPPVAQSNQTLLNQINNTLTQRRTEHQILTTDAILRSRAVVTPRRGEK